MTFFKVCYTEIGRKGARERKVWELYGHSLEAVQIGFCARNIEDVHIIETVGTSAMAQGERAPQAA
jgi:hypothetical protein